MIFGTVIALMRTVGYIYYGNDHALTLTSDPDQISVHFLMALGMLILYFALKLGMTVLFCSDRQNSINLKVLEGKAMPVCFCREALKTWQTVLMYFVPFIVVYGVMFGVCAYQIYEEMEYGFIIMLLFISFFLAFDMALVIYLLAIKIKDKIDYISIDYHIYEVTLYKNTYFGRGGITAKSRMKELESKSKKQMFTTITACLNLQCENYAQELDKSVKICPSCGCHIYKAEVLTNVVSCLNPSCRNYGHKLKKDIEVCSLCGGKTGKLSFKFKPSLKMPAIVAALTVASGFCLIRLLMSVLGLDVISDSRPNYVLNIVNLVGYCSLPVGIVMGFISKSKLAVIIALLSALMAVGFVNFIL